MDICSVPKMYLDNKNDFYELYLEILLQRELASLKHWRTWFAVRLVWREWIIRGNLPRDTTREFTNEHH